MYQGTLEAVSNRADWFIDLQLIDEDTGQPVDDLTGVTFKMVVRTPSRPQNFTAGDYCGYSPQVVLSAVSGDSHIEVTGGAVEFHFTAAEMSALTQSTYEVGITATRDGVTAQELIAILPIVDGIV